MNRSPIRRACLRIEGDREGFRNLAALPIVASLLALLPNSFIGCSHKSEAKETVSAIRSVVAVIGVENLSSFEAAEAAVEDLKAHPEFIPVDGWGNPLLLELAPSPDSDFLLRVISYGRDGVTGPCSVGTEHCSTRNGDYYWEDGLFVNE